jgi:hypothetical protein
MASLDSLQVRALAAKGVVRQVTNDAAIGIRLKYVGTGTVTSVTVVSATSVAIITSDGGTDTYEFATYDTIGYLADAINDDGIFEARVIDALRSEGSDDWFLAAAPVVAGTDEDGNVVYDLVADTSGAATMAICLSPKGTSMTEKPSGHRVHLQEIFYNIDNTAAATALKIYQRTKDGVESLLSAQLNVDATDTTVTFASGQGKITGENDAELIVFFDGTVVNQSTNMIRVVGIRE